MQRALLCVVALAGMCSAAQAQDGARAAEKARAVSHAEWLASKQSLIDHRTTMINQTMQNLAAELAGMGASIEDRARLQASLHALPTGLLEVAPSLRTTAHVEALAVGRHSTLPDRVQAALATKALGDLNQDLVFVPHGPCRIVDTRNAGGAITGNTARAFRNFSALGQGAPSGSCNQGGSATGIGITSGTGGAIALTVTGVPPGATYGNQSFLTARPVGSTNVTATVLIEFGTPFTASNSLVIRATAGGANDFEIFAGITSHVVVDLLGFYVPAAPTALDCTTVTQTVPLAAGVGQTNSANLFCPAGYTVTGGGAYDPGIGANIIINKLSFFSATELFCRIMNNTGGALANAQCEARCCRTPGDASGRFPS